MVTMRFADANGLEHEVEAPNVFLDVTGIDSLDQYGSDLVLTFTTSSSGMLRLIVGREVDEGWVFAGVRLNQ